jgi:polyferredoxin
MTLSKLAVYARKSHRFFVILVILLGLVMMITGSAMKYPDLVPFVDPFAARRFHGLISTFFSLVLFVMILTGGFMYIYPWLIKMIKKNPS